MDRSTRRWFAYLVVTPLGLMPLGGCGHSAAEPSALVESERGIPPLLLPRVAAARSLEQDASEAAPRTTLADRMISPNAVRRLPPVEFYTANSSHTDSEADLRVADARPWQNQRDGFQIIPLPPVTESAGPADDTPYLASVPQSVMVPSPTQHVADVSNIASDDADLPDMEWPGDEIAGDADVSQDAPASLAPVDEVEVESNLDAELTIDEPGFTADESLSVAEESKPAVDASVSGDDPAIAVTPEANFPVRPLPPTMEQSVQEPALVEVPGQVPAAIAPLSSAPQKKGLSERSKAMRIISEQAAVHVRRGMSLAGRNAHYSARSEFIQALRLISQALDVANNSHEYTEALANGLRALEEADDFVPHGTQLEADLNLEAIVRSHRTPALKEDDPETLRPIFARQKYYNYAQQQLALCAEGDRSGSMALYGLAKMRASLAQQNSELASLELPKAMALYQASMLVDGDNYMASNELGVLLARYGQYDSARSMLEHSARVHAQPATWHNLAVVYQHLGHPSEVKLARQRQAQLAQAQRTSGPASAGVVWKPVDEFNRSTARTQAPVTQTPAKTAAGTKPSGNGSAAKR